MTAKDEFVQWLTRNGVVFTEEVQPDGRTNVTVPDAHYLAAQSKNSGYSGFFTLAIFEPDGSLKEIGAWE